MTDKRVLIPVLIVHLLAVCACGYIVLPDDLSDGAADDDGGWSGVATMIDDSAADGLRIELTIQNDTGDWSAMWATSGGDTVLTGDGGATDCETVVVSTGGHRLAPGFRMRGVTVGAATETEIAILHVVCGDADVSAESTLSIDYTYVRGRYNYYEEGDHDQEAMMVVELGEVATSITYPIGEAVEDLIITRDFEITAINDVLLTLTGIERTPSGLQCEWHTFNGGEYTAYVHIGEPPVIGADGIIYGLYRTPDLVSVPRTPAGGATEWTTESEVPGDTAGLYMLLSVETGKQRLYQNYAVDITDQ
ncbi:MAG: hypothetical protein E3J64_04025 [Anaerolineales bacterium]|nr:MAG: hypothetical protein E3J64_04025 [Anaerolineales bacterium]